MHVIDDNTRRFGRLLHYTGVLATVVCATAAYSLVHAPTIRNVTATSARIEELRLSVKNAPIAREHHQRVSEKLRDVTARIAAVQRRVPRDADAGAFLKEVTQLASAEDVAIKDFHPEKPVGRGGYAEMHVTLKGTGSYASICTFLDRLSKLTRLSKVKDLSLSAVDDAGNYPMTATLVIFFGLQGKEESATAGASEQAQGGVILRESADQVVRESPDQVVRGSPNPAQRDPVGRPGTKPWRSATTWMQEGRRG